MRRDLRIVSLALVLLMATAATACDSQSTNTTVTPETAQAAAPPPNRVAQACRGDLKIGLSQINLQALHFNHIDNAAQRVADEAGVKLQIVSANDDPLNQTAAFDQFVAQGFDAIIVDAIDMVGINTAIDAAAAAGVPVVNVDSFVESPNLVSSITTDSAQAGSAAAAFLGKQTTKRGQVGVVTALNSVIQIQRQDGFISAATADGFSEGPVVDGKNVQETAQSAAENLLTGNSEIEFAYATGEPALIGLAAAVTSQNAEQRITAVGWDLSDTAVDGIRNGWLKGVVQQNPIEMGYEAMNTAIDAACGRQVKRNVTVPTSIVTKDNLPDYLYFLKEQN